MKYNTIYYKDYYKRNQEKIRNKSRKWAKENPEKVKAAWKKWESKNKQNRRDRTLKKYNLTHNDYLKLFESQKGVCVICKQPELRKHLLVDHSHVTGKVRGLLCDRCNRGIGLFKDNSDFLLSAHNYLKNNA